MSIVKRDGGEIIDAEVIEEPDALAPQQPVRVHVALGQCATCRHWAPAPNLTKPGGPKLGHCRARPPVLAGTNTHGLPDASWPITTDADGCGEHQRR